MIFQWKTLLTKMACCVVPSLHELTAEEVEAKLGIGKTHYIYTHTHTYIYIKEKLILEYCNILNVIIS